MYYYMVFVLKTRAVEMQKKRQASWHVASQSIDFCPASTPPTSFKHTHTSLDADIRDIHDGCAKEKSNARKIKQELTKTSVLKRQRRRGKAAGVDIFLQGGSPKDELHVIPPLTFSLALVDRMSICSKCLSTSSCASLLRTIVDLNQGRLLACYGEKKKGGDE